MSQTAVAEVQTAVADVAAAAGQLAGEAATVEAALETAAARVATAEETAQAVMDAAMMTALGQRMAALEERVTEWLNDYGPRVNLALENLTQLQSQMTTVLTTLDEISEEIPEAPIVIPAEALSAAGTDQSLIPAASELTAEAASIVTPETVPPAATAPGVVILAAPKRRVRLL